MKLINKKLISILLIFLGITIMLYPKMREKYITYKQNKLISLWEENLQTIDTNITNENNIADNDNLENNTLIYIEDELTKEILLEKNFNTKLRNEQRELQEEERKKKEVILKKRQEFIDSHMEGILKIDKISLSLPILKGATKENLNLSIASIDGTGRPWNKGNYAIAGHRSHTFGRNFNRLDELVIGDSIVVVDVDNNSFSYIVKQKLIVNAEDVWVLNNTKDKKEITLITCHPLYAKHPPTRLIIKGEMVK